MRPAVLLALVVSVVLFLGFAPAFLRADYPKPSPYPRSWELKFEHGIPKRVVVQVQCSPVPKAYWYLTYTVTNETDIEQLFLPAFSAEGGERCSLPRSRAIDSKGVTISPQNQARTIGVRRV